VVRSKLIIRNEPLTSLAEHVFEGQLIGDFFTHWLDQGKASALAAQTSTAQVSCSNIKNLFLTAYRGSPWKIDGETVPFIEKMLYELGNIAHLDRLTIFMGRPNLRKGIVSFSSFFHVLFWYLIYDLCLIR